MSQQQKQIRDAIILTAHLFLLLVIHLLLLVLCLLMFVLYLLLLVPYLLLLLVEFAVVVGNFGPPYFLQPQLSTLDPFFNNKNSKWPTLQEK